MIKILTKLAIMAKMVNLGGVRQRLNENSNERSKSADKMANMATMTSLAKIQRRSPKGSLV